MQNSLNTNSQIPDGLEVKEQSYLHLSAIINPRPNKIIGSSINNYGTRLCLGPFALECFTTDIEPKLEPWKGLRLVVWNPITKTEPQNGWWRNLFAKSGLQEGFVKLTPNYLYYWSNHAKRHLKKWQNSNQYILYISTIEEFEKAYVESKKLTASLRDNFLASVRSHLAIHPQDVRIHLVKNLENNKNIAGLITIDYPDINQSVHTVSFICSEAQKTSVGYGLINRWHQEILERKINWLNFGFIWQENDPISWQGYSKFKLQFNLQLIKFPRNYFKITLGN